jgi:hypothetical protein
MRKEKNIVANRPNEMENSASAGQLQRTRVSRDGGRSLTAAVD